PATRYPAFRYAGRCASLTMPPAPIRKMGRDSKSGSRACLTIIGSYVAIAPYNVNRKKHRSGISRPTTAQPTGSHAESVTASEIPYLLAQQLIDRVKTQ